MHHKPDDNDRTNNEVSKEICSDAALASLKIPNTTKATVIPLYNQSVEGRLIIVQPCICSGLARTRTLPNQCTFKTYGREELCSPKENTDKPQTEMRDFLRQTKNTQTQCTDWVEESMS